MLSTVSKSTMGVTIFSLVFLFVREIKDVHSSTPVPGNLDLAEWQRSNSKLQSPSSLSSNPCYTPTIQSGAPNVHFTCHSQCMALRSEISIINNMFPNCKATQYLHERCGMVTEGTCSTATSPAVCWCYTQTNSNDHRRNTLSNCRGGIHIMHEFTTAKRGMFAKDTTKMIYSPAVEAVHMQTMPPSRHPTGRRSPRKRRPNTNIIAACCGLGNRSDSPDDSAPILPSGNSAGPSVPPPNKQKSIARASSSSSSSQSSGAEYLPENRILFTTVRVSGQIAEALVDTGAALCIIHPYFAGNFIPAKTNLFSVGEERDFQVLGKSTVQLLVATGVTIPLTGFVADRGYDLLLGTDFFVAWAAKIRISDGTMQLNTGLSQPIMKTQFVRYVAPFAMMNLHPEGYTSLRFSAIVNGVNTRVVLDTGAGISIVGKNVVHQRIRGSTARGSFGGSSFEGFSGTAKINLVIESNSLTVPVFVPNFQTDFPLLVGSDFIQQYVELIDYESKSVTFKFPGPSGTTLFTTRAVIMNGE